MRLINRIRSEIWDWREAMHALREQLGDMPAPGESEDLEPRDDGEAPPHALDPTIPIIDVRAKAAKERYPAGKSWSGSGKVRRTLYPPRPRGICTAVMLHQTAVDRGPEATARRAHCATCHYLVSQDGTVYIVHPHTTRLVAGHGSDRKPWYAVHIEVMGSFDGRPPSPRGGRVNWGVGHTTLSPKQRDGVLRAIALAIDTESAMGGKIEHILAHRQFSESRGADPGYEVWGQCTRRAMDLWGLRNDGRAYGGLSIPPEWRV